MKIQFALSVSIALCGVYAESVSACEQMQVTPSTVEQGGVILLQCKPSVEVIQIAAEIIGTHWNQALPHLYDDGSHGDAQEGDQQYSVQTQAPTIAGEYQVNFYQVLPDQTEILVQGPLIRVQP